MLHNCTGQSKFHHPFMDNIFGVLRMGGKKQYFLRQKFEMETGFKKNYFLGSVFYYMVKRIKFSPKKLEQFAQKDL